MAYIKVKDGDINVALKKFNDAVFREGILQEYMENQYYTKPSEKKRMDKKKQKFDHMLKNRNRD